MDKRRYSFSVNREEIIMNTEYDKPLSIAVEEYGKKILAQNDKLFMDRLSHLGIVIDLTLEQERRI